MRINPIYRLHRVGRHYMIVDRCAGNTDLANVYSLNATAGRLWIEAAGRDFSASDLTAALLRDYDVEETRAAADVDALLRKWSAAGFII